jgi:Zn-dependent M28 family amino/carboxypeptidase
MDADKLGRRAHLDHIGRFGDHIYNGANDDASGCVAELGAAVNLEQLGSKHRTAPGVWALGDPQFKQAFLQAGGHTAGFSAEELPFSPADSVSDVLSNTDTYSFMHKHIPSLLLGSGGFSEHHTPMDTIELIDFDPLQKATTLVFRLITTLTND